MPNTDWLAFVIGDVAHRVSIHTQQLRALNLISQLQSGSAPFRDAESVAVIGGGMAGITTAAALKSVGKTVRIFERKKRLIPLQYYSRTRYIHPTAINWPHTPLRPVTNLPFLNWHCGFGETIAKHVHELFNDEFEQQNEGRIKSLVSSDVIEVNHNCNNATQPFSITYDSLENESKEISTRTEEFSSVFFACGFGEEKSINPYNNYKYWEDASICPINSSLKPPVIGIVGDGDGALIEVFRCFWRNRSLDELIRLLTESHIAEECKGSILAYDNRIITKKPSSSKDASGEKGDTSSEQRKIYSQALTSDNARSLLNHHMEFHTEVVIYSPRDEPFSDQASPLHKVLLAFLLDHPHGIVRHVKGRVTSVSYRPKKVTTASSWRGI